MAANQKQLSKHYQSDASHPLFSPLKRAVRIDAETFGKLIVLTWAVKKGRSELPNRELLAREFLTHRDSLPTKAKDVLHPEARAIGKPAIAEYSDYMSAAQDAGFIKRYNPAYIRCRIELGRLEARDRLDEYRKSYGSVIRWLEDRVTNLA